MSKLIRHCHSFTLRLIEDGPAKADQDAVDAIQEAVSAAMLQLNTPGHLFVTVVSAWCIATSEEDYGFALYQQGLQTIAVAGARPDDWPDSHGEWLDELKRSTAHEVVHYWQDLNGTLDGSEENEAEAERLANEIFPREIVTK